MSTLRWQLVHSTNLQDWGGPLLKYPRVARQLLTAALGSLGIWGTPRWRDTSVGNYDPSEILKTGHPNHQVPPHLVATLGANQQLDPADCREPKWQKPAWVCLKMGYLISQSPIGSSFWFYSNGWLVVKKNILKKWWSSSMGRTSHIWNGKIWKNKGHVPNHQNGYVSEYHHVQSPKCSQQCHLAQWGGLFHLSHHGDSSSWRVTERHRKTSMTYKWHGYGSIPMHTIFRGMNIHLPAILMFTRGTRFWHTATCLCQEDCGRFEVFRCWFKNPRADNNFIAAVWIETSPSEVSGAGPIFSELQVQLLLQSMRLGSALKPLTPSENHDSKAISQLEEWDIGGSSFKLWDESLKPTIWSMKTGRQKAISRIKQARRSKATRNPKKKLILKHRKSGSKDKVKM